MVTFLLRIGRLKVQKSLLLRTLMHDIASPLSVITMKCSADPSIAHAKEKILDILKTVGNLDRAELDQAKLLRGNFPIYSVLDKLIGPSHLILENKGIEIVTNIDANLKDITVVGDGAIFANHIAGNILSNAIKFSPVGSKIKISATKIKDQVEFKISDSGLGMGDMMLSNLFHFDKNSSNLGTNGEKGSGLGMPIMKALCDLLKIKVKIDSHESRGTTFTLLLKVATSIKL